MSGAGRGGGPRTAVLGAGILGTCTALLLAEAGRAVTVVDAAAAPVGRASRWNEGKIHLGYLYAADPSLASARRMLSGATRFRPVVERLTGLRLADVATVEDDLMCLHRDSVVGADGYRAYQRAVDALVADLPRPGDYLVDLADASSREVRPADVPGLAGDGVVAAFRAPERSVDTAVVADALVAALAAQPLVDLRLSTRVRAVRPRDDGRWALELAREPAGEPVGEPGADGPNGGERVDLGAFDVVVNALWEGRPAVDATAGIPPAGSAGSTTGAAPPGAWTHRYRASVFARGADPMVSAVLAVGPFGDVKRYATGGAYLSWYPAGLLAETHDLLPAPVAVDAATAGRVRAATVAGLARYWPDLPGVVARADGVRVEGGWVYALGSGRLDDPASTLHRRDRAEAWARRGYVSVDTAKYSLGPAMAEGVAAGILA